VPKALNAALLAVLLTSAAYGQAPVTTTLSADGGDIIVTALGHASVQFQYAGKFILVDPVAGQTDLSRARPADVIFVTDIHPDHFDASTIAQLRKPGAPVVVPQAVAAMNRVPDPTVMIPRQMKTGDSAPAGVPVITVPAYNIQRGPSPGQLYHTRDRGQGYLLTLGNRLVYIAGDTECVPAMDVMLKRPQLDLALIPMNFPYTMSPLEAAECVKGFEPKIAIPYHYMGQKPEEFAAALKGTSIEVRLLDWYPSPGRAK